LFNTNTIIDPINTFNGEKGEDDFWILIDMPTSVGEDGMALKEIKSIAQKEFFFIKTTHNLKTRKVKPNSIIG